MAEPEIPNGPLLQSHKERLWAQLNQLPASTLSGSLSGRGSRQGFMKGPSFKSAQLWDSGMYYKGIKLGTSVVRYYYYQLVAQRSANLSVASIRYFVVPDSREEWPASGMTCKVISGHAFLSA